MANFSIDSESNQKLLNESAKAAKEAGLDASRLAQNADASFAFQDGDKLTIPAQVASVISLTGNLRDNAVANGWATGFFSFNAFVTRKGRQLPCRVSAKQLFTPTVWLEATPVGGGATISENSDEPLYTAPFREGVKRFGEQGSVTIINKVPVIQSDINVTLTSVDTAYTSVMADVERGNAALRQRTDFVMVEE